MARLALKVAAPRGVPVLLNDDLELARRLPVQGVHLGQQDAPATEARRLLGPEAWIGVSTHSLAEVEAAQRGPATHLGLGACFATATQPRARPLQSAARTRCLAATLLPVFAIGGVTPENLPELVEAGVRRVAVSACVLESLDPGEVARRLQRILAAADSNL